MKVVHSWLKDYLGDALPEAAQLEDVFNFHAFEVDGLEEVEGESVIDIDVLPNRSSDCLCHRGVARELSSILNVPMMGDPLAEKPTLATTDKISITIENESECPRFTAALITGVTVGDSPVWLQKRLRALGVRSINNIVDATNYVMYGIGQPLHAYDADLFKQVVGKWQFLIRNARVGETVSLLAEGGKNEDRIVELKGTELLIVDGATDTPIGLAGVKGGRYAGVHAGTKNIIIEAAHFNPTTTRKTARGLGIVIDASKRFENEPSRELPPYAQAEIIKLISNIAGGTFEGWADEYRQTKVNPEAVVPVAQVNALLGLSLASTDMEVILKRIGAAIVASSENSFTVVGPWERTDLNLPEDFIEEIGRIHGLSNIVSVHPNQTALPAPNVKQFCTEAVRQELLQNGFSEVITSSFTKSDVIQLQNSLASDKSYLRSKLRKNIYKVLDSNFSHIDFLGIPDVRVFEIGTVFDKTDTSVSEHPSVALGVRTKGDGYNPKDDAILKTACETVEQVLDAKLEWQVEKGVAEANLSTVLSGYEFPEPSNEMIFTHSNVTNQFKAYSNYPAMSRDIALWVQEGELAYDVEETIGHAAGDLCVRLSLFDTFTKDGRTSYAFRIVFQSFERTLTDIEINDQMERAYSVTKEKGWEVR